MKFGYLFLVHVGLSVDSALVAELWREREIIKKPNPVVFKVDYFSPDLNSCFLNIQQFHSFNWSQLNCSSAGFTKQQKMLYYYYYTIIQMKLRNVRANFH